MNKVMLAAGAMGVLFLLLLLFMATGGGESSKPITTPTTVEHASEYFAISNEIGVPWDLVLLIDTILADEAGKGDILDINPLQTSLNFAYIEVISEKWYEDDRRGGWEEYRRDYYHGYAEISAMLGLTETDTIADLAEKLQAYDEGRRTSEVRTNSNIYAVGPEQYRETVEQYYSGQLEEMMIEDIFVLYDSKYLYHLYFEEVLNHEGADFTGFEVPDVTVGDVTRAELVEVAVSLVNRPYLFGGKSAFVGPPRSLLDCSGYVDWVYMQCFEQLVSGGFGGTTAQYNRCQLISEHELRPGDLGFYYSPSGIPAGQYNHVGIYVGEIGGKPAFIHCGGPYWGYPGSESGRVIVSINDRVTVNTTSPLGGTFPYPAMNPSNFVIFMRPPFVFADDPEEWKGGGDEEEDDGDEYGENNYDGG